MISCKEYVLKRKEELKKEISTYTEKPHLVVIQVDNDPASNSYIKGKKKDAEEVGIKLTHTQIDSSKMSQVELEDMVRELGKTRSVHGIIIQLPIPDKYDVNKLLECIPKEKDVDGFRKDSLFKPCTPKGIIDWLKFNNYDFVGKDVVVLGRSKIVGLPLVNMLIYEGSTVTCCNSKTKPYSRLHALRKANMVISAVGKPKFLDSHDFYDIDGNNHLEVIVDVGINRDENGKLCGDVDREDCEKYLPNTYITTVPGGVGKLTVLSLMENTVEAYKRMKIQKESD